MRVRHEVGAQVNSYRYTPFIPFCRAHPNPEAMDYIIKPEAKKPEQNPIFPKKSPFLRMASHLTHFVFHLTECSFLPLYTLLR